MAEKKHEKEKEIEREEEVMETRAEAVAEAEVGERVSAEIEALKKQLEKAEAEASEFKDSWMRSQAELQNYRKRVERDNELTRTLMKGDLVKKILPLLDDLERAAQNRPAGDTWADGIELILRKFQATLEGEGVKKIEAEGAAFDPNFHEAISSEHHEDFESGQVIEVVRNGYMLGDHVIRPALVRVAQ
ncbi:MAG: nucleotide exchange factor GrpE [Anaerolineales bacterium]|nr:nucleotide exchange factor GrpE [Anaerolineales bacterium]NUQ85984.1 nucleotide exchange factor GrpE [Anaerolineales bacterium]